MRFYLLICASLTLVCEGFTRDIASQKDEGTLRGTSEKIEYPLDKLNFNQENMLKLREPRRLKTPLLHQRIFCHESNSEGPCRQKRLSYQPIVIDVPRYVTRTQTKNDRAAHRRTTRRTRRPCVSRQFASTDKKTSKIQCNSHYMSSINRGRRYQASASIAAAPARHPTPDTNPCPPGTYKNRLGQCWTVM